MPFSSSPSSPGSLSPSRYYARAFALATTAVLGYLLYRVLLPFLTPLVWAALLAFLFQPLNRRIVDRWKRPALSAALITVLVGLIILGPVSLFGVAFVRQASDLLSRFQAEAHDRKLPALQLVLELSPVQGLLARVGDFSSLSKEQILEQANDTAQAALQTLASAGGGVLLGAFNVATKFGLTMFLLFFFVRDGREMLTRAVRLVPMSDDRKDELQGNLGAVTRGVVMGTLATSLVQGTLIGVGFAISGLPSPVVFGAIGAMASLVPFVGTTLVWLPAVISLVATGQTGWAVFLAIWCAGPVTLSDNIIRPWVASTSSNVSTLLVFVGVLGGISAFGFAGFFIGPVLLTLVAALLRYADESQLGTLAPGSLPSSPSAAVVRSPAPAPSPEPKPAQTPPPSEPKPP